MYHLSTKVVARSKGQSAVAGAAYLARMVLTNERTGETWNYSRKKADVLFEGIFAPKGAPEWMRDAARLWNGIEKAERQHNSQVARAFIIGLPHQLTLEQQRYAVQDWVKENFTRPGFVAHVAIHRPDPHGDQRNAHAHIQVTMRKVEGDGFATRKERSIDRLADLERWRESWERIGNTHLKRWGFEAVLDRRSFEDQGITDRLPTIHLGKSAAMLERNGLKTDRGDELRDIRLANDLAATISRLQNLEAEQRQAEQRRQERERFAQEVAEAEYLAGRTAGNMRRQEVAAEPVKFVSAIDRLKAEDGNAGQEQPPHVSLSHHVKELFSALWRLGRTMGATISQIVPAADPDTLKGQIRAEYKKARPAPSRTEKPAADPDEGKKQNTLDPLTLTNRDKQAAPYRAMLQDLRGNAPLPQPPPKVPPQYAREEIGARQQPQTAPAQNTAANDNPLKDTLDKIMRGEYVSTPEDRLKSELKHALGRKRKISRGIDPTADGD